MIKPGFHMILQKIREQAGSQKLFTCLIADDQIFFCLNAKDGEQSQKRAIYSARILSALELAKYELLWLNHKIMVSIRLQNDS